MIVKIRGIIYPSVKAAAAAHGVKENTIYEALSKNRTDGIGLGVGGGQKGKTRRKPDAPIGQP